MFAYQAAEVFKAFAFGKVNPSPTDYGSHIRRPKLSKSARPTITYNALDYLRNGPGRFVNLSMFSVIEKFFY